MIYLNEKQKEQVREMMNPPGHNHKDCNFFKVLQEHPDGYTVEVGYWIQYIGCRPKYQKEVVFLKK
jgi:hypothetical protein